MICWLISLFTGQGHYGLFFDDLITDYCVYRSRLLQIVLLWFDNWLLCWQVKVIEETIRYIDELHRTLAQRINESEAGRLFRYKK